MAPRAVVLLSAQGMSPRAISEVVFTDPDTVLIHSFNTDGFDGLYPCYRGGRPQTFALPKCQEIKRIALSDPQDLDQPFATWSLSKLADYRLNRIEAQFRALRYFTLTSTDHPDHATQARLIRRYIDWRNRNTNNPRLRRLINTANVA